MPPLHGSIFSRTPQISSAVHATRGALPHAGSGPIGEEIMTFSRVLSRRLSGVLMGGALAAAAWAAPALAAEKVLRIGMTAADIPKTNGQPDQGFEGNRFTGIPLFDALTHWDLSSADKPSVLIPGLATEWKVDGTDKTKWVFTLRPGVMFHDGPPVNADAIVWNVEKVLKKDAPHFAPDQVGVTVSRMPTLRSARKIDDMTVELKTSEP